jgi:hypothetical protein
MEAILLGSGVIKNLQRRVAQLVPSAKECRANGATESATYRDWIFSVMLDASTK